MKIMKTLLKTIGEALILAIGAWIVIGLICVLFIFGMFIAIADICYSMANFF